MRLNAWVFLGKLFLFFALTYLAWKPAAPYYTRFLFEAARVGVWLVDQSSDPLWRNGTSLRRGNLCVGAPYGGSAVGCGSYCGSSKQCPDGVECVAGMCDTPCVSGMACARLCGESAVCKELPATGIFYSHRNFAAFQTPIPPQGIPAEWVMANLLLLIPLMLATPAPSWRARFGRLALAAAIAVLLQVADMVVNIKSFYASTFRGYWSPFAAQSYQFLDVFFQSYDTQLFPFAIWAGIHFRQLLGSHLQPAGAVPLERKGSKASPAERQRKRRGRRRTKS